MLIKYLLKYIYRYTGSFGDGTGIWYAIETFSPLMYYMSDLLLLAYFVVILRFFDRSNRSVTLDAAIITGGGFIAWILLALYLRWQDFTWVSILGFFALCPIILLVLIGPSLQAQWHYIESTKPDKQLSYQELRGFFVMLGVTLYWCGHLIFVVLKDNAFKVPPRLIVGWQEVVTGATSWWWEHYEKYVSVATNFYTLYVAPYYDGLFKYFETMQWQNWEIALALFIIGGCLLFGISAVVRQILNGVYLLYAWYTLHRFTRLITFIKFDFEPDLWYQGENIIWDGLTVYFLVWVGFCIWRRKHYIGLPKPEVKTTESKPKLAPLFFGEKEQRRMRLEPQSERVSGSPSTSKWQAASQEGDGGRVRVSERVSGSPSTSKWQAASQEGDSGYVRLITDWDAEWARVKNSGRGDERSSPRPLEKE